MNARQGRRCCSSSAATRSTTRRPTSASREALEKVGVRGPPRPLRGRDRRRCATGTCPRRTTSRRGATRAPSTARSRSSSRSSRRSTAASRRTRCWSALLGRRPGRRGVRRRCATPGQQAAAGAGAARTSSAFWRTVGCTTASSPARAFRAEGASTAGRRVRARIGAAAPAPRAGPRDRLPRPTRRSTTAASRTTAGCRSCRSRSRSSTWDNARPGRARRRPSGSASRNERRRRGRASAGARCSGAGRGSCPARPTTRSTVHLGLRPHARRAASATASASTPTRCARPRRLWFGAGRAVAKTGRPLRAGEHAGSPRSMEGRAHRPRRRRSSEYRDEPGLRPARWHDEPAEDAHAVSRASSTRATRGAWRST